MKTLDRILGRSVAYFLPKRKTGEIPTHLQRILFIRPGGIGDGVLLIAGIEMLHKKYPKASIEVLAEKRNSGIFNLCPYVTRIWHYDRLWEFLMLFGTRFDCIIDTEQWYVLTSVVSRFFLRTPIVIGFATNNRGKFYTHAVPYSHDDYEVDSFLHLISLLIGTTTRNHDKFPFLRVPVSDRKHAHSLLKQVEDKPLIAIFPGGSIPERHWNEERFVQLIDEFIRRDFAVVVLGGVNDKERGDRIIADNTLALNLAGQTTLAQAAAVIAMSRLLVSGDSGLLHIGYSLGIPTVGLFGPGIIKKWAPKGPQHRTISRNLPCSPCTRFGTTPPCPHNAACLKAISVEEVLGAATELLAY